MAGTRLIAAHFGYAEDQHPAVMLYLWENDEAFATPLHALADLAYAFLIKFIDEQQLRRDRKSCCVEFIGRATPNDQFCPVCRRSILAPPLDLESFGSYVRDISTRELDGYGEPLRDMCPWTEFPTLADVMAVPREEAVEIPAYAERVIPLALRGDEFDDPEHGYHEHADILRQGVDIYWQSRPWVEGDPETRDDLERILETYRVSTGGD